MIIEATQLVDDIMRRWPATIRVFLSHKMRCIGCPIACFHTVDDACREHGIDCSGFLAVLNETIARNASESSEAAAIDPMSIAARWPLAGNPRNL
jgi:hybrid cluster-associated redox disulfide protein